MRASIVIPALLSCLAAGAAAQDPPRAEIGTALGLTIDIPDGGDAVTSVGIPGAGGLFGASTLYATVFTDRGITVEPQLGLSVVSARGSTIWTTSVMLQLGYLLQPDARSSAYLAVHGGLLAAGNGSSEASGAAGAGVGYRSQVTDGGAIRFEALYRRWFGDIVDEVNSIVFRFAFGLVIP